VAAHSDTVLTFTVRHFRRTLDKLRPQETDADRVRRYREDPVAFAIEVLGIKPWSKQIEILRAVLRHKRVAVVSGHKCGKSTALAILALWFYCSFPGARVVITATTDRQVNGIIWREIKRLCRGARIKIPGSGDIKAKASSGLTDETDFSEIRGYTAKEAEAIAGTSGGYLMYLVDEASGVDAKIFEAIDGNRMGGNAWVFLISNPTKADGEFFEAFHSKAYDPVSRPRGYFGIRIDSRESPNITGEWRELGDAPIPGLADQEAIEEKLVEWGEDSPLFKIRIAGLFCAAEDAKIFNSGMIVEACTRWHDVEATGRLWIGVDPAGDGDGGDESGFAARRGARCLEVRLRSGLGVAAHIDAVLDLIDTHNEGTKELPVVVVDSAGEVGWEVYKALRDHAELHGRFVVVRVRPSDKAVRQPAVYATVRDELWANARAWMREGGAIPEHVKLSRDLHAPEFFSDDKGRLKVTPKKELRKVLGRSPDGGDAFTLCCWEPVALREERGAPEPPPQAGGGRDDISAMRGGDADPYGGRMSPYGGKAANDNGDGGRIAAAV
jgi:phage terminase large subunit